MVIKSLRWVRAVICLSFLCSVLISFDLWRSKREFCVLPVFSIFDDLAFWVTDFWFALLLFLLIAGAFVHKKIIFVSMVIVIFVFALADQMRIQPWVYFFILIMLPFSFYNKQEVTGCFLAYIKWIFAAVYFWSGINKLNLVFYKMTYRRIINDLLHLGEFPWVGYLYKLAPIIGVIEILVALMILLPRWRQIGAATGIASHLFIITFLSVFGINHNQVVLPWNVCMMIILAVLFLRQSKARHTLDRKIYMPVTTCVVVLLVWFLPAYNFFSGHLTNFAFSLYSGKVDNYLVVFSPEEDIKELERFEPYFSTLSRFKEEPALNVHRYALDKLNVPFYPSEKAFKQFAEKFCREHPELMEIEFMQLDQLQLKQPDTFSCDFTKR